MLVSIYPKEQEIEGTLGARGNLRVFNSTPVLIWFLNIVFWPKDLKNTKCIQWWTPALKVESRCSNNEVQLFSHGDSCVASVPFRISVTQCCTVHKQPKESESHQQKNQSTLSAQTSPPISPPSPAPSSTKHVTCCGLALILSTKSACQRPREPSESPALLWFTPLPKQFYKTMTLISFRRQQSVMASPGVSTRASMAAVGTRGANVSSRFHSVASIWSLMSIDLYLIRKEPINISHCIRHISADDFIARRSWSSVCAPSADINLANFEDEMDRRRPVPNWDGPDQKGTTWFWRKKGQILLEALLKFWSWWLLS